jgi:hypothetical protein
MISPLAAAMMLLCHAAAACCAARCHCCHYLTLPLPSAPLTAHYDAAAAFRYYFRRRHAVTPYADVSLIYAIAADYAAARYAMLRSRMPPDAR